MIVNEAKKKLPKSIFNGLIPILDVKDPIFRKTFSKITSFESKRISDSSVEKDVDPEISKFEVFQRLNPIDFDNIWHKISHERNLDLEYYIEELKMAANYLNELSKLHGELRKSLNAQKNDAIASGKTFIAQVEFTNIKDNLKDTTKALQESYNKINSNINELISEYKK